MDATFKSGSITKVSQTVTLGFIGLIFVACATGVLVLPEKSTEIIGFCTMIVVYLFKMIQDSMVATAAAEKVEEVKKVAETTVAKQNTTLNRIEQVGSTNHKFLNSKVGFQLKKQAISERRIANLTGLPDDIKRAEEAEAESVQHQEAQAVVDAKNSSTDVEELKVPGLFTERKDTP